MFSKLDFFPGTVVQYRDEFAGDDRSYRVVFNWNEAESTMDVKMTINPEGMETISKERLKIIARCDADGNLSWS